MKVFQDKYKNIYTDLDYADDKALLEPIFWENEKEVFHVDHEDFVASVPGSMTLGELDENLKEFQMYSNILAPKKYSISKILAEYQDNELLKKVLGLNLIHIDGSQTQTGAKVIKNVSGYDMKKLYIGSYNSLALISNAFIRLEKLFEKELIFEFKIKNNFDLICDLKNYLQSFLDNRISLKLTYNRLFDDFDIKIKTSANKKILEYRKEALIDFITKELETINLVKVKEQDFSYEYKDTQRIELKFELSKLNRIITNVDQDQIVIEPLTSTITLKNHSMDFTKILSSVNKIKIFPVNQKSLKLLRELDSTEDDFIKEIKTIYDQKGQLNPKVLT